MSTIKITGLTSSGAIVGNVILPMVGNVAGTLTTLRGTVDQLKTFITAGAEANVLAANAATIFANTIMKNYVDLANTIQSAQLTSANTIQSAQIASANLGIVGYVDNAVSTANIGIIGYVELGNTIQSQQITAANIGIIGYVELGNTIQSQQITAANLGIIGYVDNKVSTANIGIIGYIGSQVSTANIGMKGYVDNQTYSNVQVTTYLPTYSGNIADVITSGNLVVFGNTFINNSYVPALANSTGLAGQIVWDSNYIYICVSTNTWKRSNVAAW
jgi:hypothetical protein